MTKLDADTGKKLTQRIEDYFLNEFDERIGLVKCGKILDLFTEELSPIVHNRALDQAKRWFQDRLSDVEYDYDALYRSEE